MTDATSLDAHLAAAPDATSRAALLGIDFVAFEQASNRLKATTVVVAIASALTVIVVGGGFQRPQFGEEIPMLALGMLLGILPFAVSLLAASAVVHAVRARLSPRAVTLLSVALSAGLAALVTVVAARLLMPLGAAVLLGFAAGIAVGSALPVLSIAALPNAFRRPNPALAAAVQQFRSFPAHKTTLDGRFAHIIGDHAAGQFMFIAIVPIAVVSPIAGVLAALVLCGVTVLTVSLDLRVRPVASLVTSIAAAGVFLAAAIVSAR